MSMKLSPKCTYIWQHYCTVLLKIIKNKYTPLKVQIYHCVREEAINVKLLSSRIASTTSSAVDSIAENIIKTTPRYCSQKETLMAMNYLIMISSSQKKSMMLLKYNFQIYHCFTLSTSFLSCCWLNKHKVNFGEQLQSRIDGAQRRGRYLLYKLRSKSNEISSSNFKDYLKAVRGNWMWIVVNYIYQVCLVIVIKLILDNI